MSVTGGCQKKMAFLDFYPLISDVRLRYGSLPPAEMERHMNGRLLASKHRRKVLLALGWYAGQIHHGVAQFARQAGWILNLEALRCGVAPESWRGDGIIAI